MPKIVITGAHGFVGRHVVDAILALPNELFSEICVVDRTAALDAHARAVRDARLRFIVADLTDADETAAALRNCACVVHLAGVVDTRSGLLHDARIRRANVLTTQRVVDACRVSGATLIYLSSAGALSDGIWGDDVGAIAGTGRASTYGRTKREAEECVLAAAAAGAFCGVSLRPQVVFGPGDPLFTEDMLLSARPPPAMGSGAAYYTPIYVRNLAAYIARLAHELTADAPLAARLSGKALCIGDAHARCSEVHSLLLSCRADAPTQWTLPLFVGFLIACVAYVVDWLTLGTRNWRVLKLTFAALYYMDGAHFRFPKDEAYEAIGFDPPYAWPDGIKSDLAAFVTSGGRRDYAAASAPTPPPPPVLWAPWRLRGLRLRNRLIKEATFEAGCTRDGVPTRTLLEFHESVARGGTALTTVAYAAVAADGRSFATQLLMREESAPMLKELTARVHAAGGAACVQLTHAGSFADRNVIGGRQIAPSSTFNPAGMDWPRAMTADDIERVADDFAAAAALARRCGFDAVQIHCGHGYLISQFLSPATNLRRDEHGAATTEGRTRFARLVCRRVRAAVGEAMPIVVKMNLEDGFSGGATLDDAVKFAQVLERDGTVDLLVPSGGWISRNGFFMLRGPVPLKEMIVANKKPVQRLALRLFGRALVPAIPYEAQSPYFREQALVLMAHLGSGLPLCLVGGVDSLKVMEGALRDGFAAVAAARALLREPDLPKRLQAEGAEAAPSACVRCNLCIVGSAMAEEPVGCAQRGEVEW